MKIQCSCGTKYSFDVTPQMGQHPVRFACQTCGLDLSDFINGLIRQELAATASPPPPPPPPPPAPAAAPPPPLAAETPHAQIRPATAAAPAAPAPAAHPQCIKHPGHLATHRCLVCQKPMCPKCMELFGYVCSPYCSSRAEAQGIDIPVYKGKRSVQEAHLWRKVALIGGAIGVVLAGLLGVWFWYAWFGSMPKPVFSVRFPEPSYSGKSILCDGDQLVFLHGDTLARYDLKEKKQIWSRALIDRKELAQEVDRRLKELRAARSRVAREKPAALKFFSIPSTADLTKVMESSAAAALKLHVRGHKIWIASPGKLVQYDWNTGNAGAQVPVAYSLSGLITRGDELVSVSIGAGGQRAVNHINLLNGELHTEPIGKPSTGLADGTIPATSNQSGPASTPGGQQLAGLPIGMPGANAGKPMDPAKVAAQAQHLSTPAKIALPVLLANNRNQERIMAALEDSPRRRGPVAPATAPDWTDETMFLPSQSGFIQYSVQLLQKHIVTREAMKPPPKNSALNANVSVADTSQVANEILNEMQRDRGGGYVTEDLSRYRVIVRHLGSGPIPNWTGEVVGPPSVIPLKTVTVVAAGKQVIVLDNQNRKLWDATFSHNVEGGAMLASAPATGSQGTCVEHGDSLYVCDEAVLTAFNLATGDARWRIPSVGISGLFFDNQGMLYVNTTTASPDTIKYSRQIDVTQTTRNLVLKINPQTGKTLWAVEPNGWLAYVSGKFIYTLNAYDAHEELMSRQVRTGLEMPSHVVIKRLNPANGHELWNYYDKRVPLDVQFTNNSIQLVFKKEVEVLHYFSF